MQAFAGLAMGGHGSATAAALPSADRGSIFSTAMFSSDGWSPVRKIAKG